MRLNRRSLRHRFPLPLLGILSALLLADGTSAHGQWGFGMGFGYGFGMNGGGSISNAATMRNTNTRSSQAAQAAFAARGQMQGATNANSYINHTRDASYIQRFDVSSRRTIGHEAAGRATTNAPVAESAAGRGVGAARSQVLPVTSYFNASGEFVWPSIAPVEGTLGEQSSKAGAAVQAVYREVQENGRASVAMVSNARDLLVQYGQPALAELRQSSTDAVADEFHRFLLGLYDSLGMAAASPSATGAAADASDRPD